MSRVRIETRTTKWPREDTEARRRKRIQQRLIGCGFAPVEDWMPLAGVAVAYVNHGRWVAVCPLSHLGCRGAELVDPEWPLFVCCEGCGSGPFVVLFPADRERIERLLLSRPMPQNMNWTPFETAADLEEENRNHLVGVS